MYDSVLPTVAHISQLKICEVITAFFATQLCYISALNTHLHMFLPHLFSVIAFQLVLIVQSNNVCHNLSCAISKPLIIIHKS